jgi:hypothetical protein
MTQNTPLRRAARYAALTSMACLLVMTTMVVVAGALTPGYSHVSQFISELGARGAPYEWPVRVLGFLPAGVLLLAFCWLANRSLPRSTLATLALLGLALYAAGYLVAAAFPCDPGCRPDRPSVSQSVHNAAGVLGYVFAPASLLALGRTARRWPNAGWLSVFAYAAAGFALLGLLTLSPGSPAAGLSQRLLEIAVLGWVALCGRYLGRRREHDSPR